MTATPDGGFWAAWIARTEIASFRIQKFDSTGQKVGQLIEIPGVSSVDAPVISETADGGFWIGGIANVEGEARGFIQRFDADGQPQTAQQFIETTLGAGRTFVFSDMILAVPGGVLVAHVERPDANGIDEITFLQAYGLDGTAIGTALEFGEAHRTRLTELEDGTIALLQTQGGSSGSFSNGFEVTLYDANLNGPLYPTITGPLGTTGIGNTHVTALVGGGFVITTSKSGPAALVAQIYDATGNTVGSEWEIETFRAPIKLEVSARPEGGFFVIWQEWVPGIETRSFFKALMPKALLCSTRQSKRLWVLTLGWHFRLSG